MTIKDIYSENNINFYIFGNIKIIILNGAKTIDNGNIPYTIPEEYRPTVDTINQIYVYGESPSANLIVRITGEIYLYRSNGRVANDKDAWGEIFWI